MTSVYAAILNSGDPSAHGTGPPRDNAAILRDIASLPSIHVPVSFIGFLLVITCGNNKQWGAKLPQCSCSNTPPRATEKAPAETREGKAGSNKRKTDLPELYTEPRMLFGVPYASPALQHIGGVPVGDGLSANQTMEQ